MDNPLIVIKYKTDDGKQICVEVSTAVKELLQQSDRQIRSHGRQDRRYLDKEEYIDDLTDTTTVYPQEGVADLAIRMELIEKLYVTMEKLSETQRRRIVLHFHEELTYRQIAQVENISQAPIGDSITYAIRILKAEVKI